MGFRQIWVLSAALLSGCSVAKPTPSTDWTSLRMGMSYAQVVKIVGPPQRKLQPGEHLEGVVIPTPSMDVYVWQFSGVTKSAAFSDNHLNGVTSQLD